MSDDAVKLLGLVLAALSGGLAGSIVTRSFASRRAKLDLAVSLVREFMTKDEAFAFALSVLAEAAGRKTISPEDRNGVWSVGDWLETASYLGSKRHCDFAVLDEAGLVDQARRFRNALAEAARVDPTFGDAARRWRYLNSV